MDDPNKVLVEILKEEDPEFRDLHNRLDELQTDLRHASTEKKRRILKEMRSVRERVEARISYARSA